MRCHKCRTENPIDAAFCEQCGIKLEALCPSCQTPVGVGARFCKKCGIPIAEPIRAASPPSATVEQTGPDFRLAHESTSEALAGERKTVTALFADIKGSTELMAELDPEEARAIIDPALKLMIDAVRRYDGYVVQSTGDGIFAVFGAPLAHEDHPQRALYAALRIQESLVRHSDLVRAEGGLPIQARIGVNTGEVVVRSIATGGGKMEYTPIGHTTNLASRMQTLAPIGSVAATDAARKLCEGYFTFKGLGPTRVKGLAEPIDVYEVTGLGPLRTRLQRAAGRGFTKFVGREHEMAALRHAADQARTGHGQIVAAMAEPGVGKSRLLFEFKAKNQSDWMVLETFSISHGKASAYLPIIELLHGYFAIEPGDDGRKRREKVTGRLLALDRSLEDTLAYLFNLLGIVEGDDPLAQMDGQIRKRRTLEAIKRIILRESLNQPLMVIFEDLHWIDEATQEFLNLLADSIGTAKILLLVNYRPEYSHQWNSKTYYTQLRLDPLAKESAEEMLATLLGAGDELAALKRLIIEKTEGNPFFIEEMVLALFDQGALVRDGTVKLVRYLDSLKIPATVQGVLAARIDRLPAEEKDLLQTLAVMGREFPLALVRHVVLKSDDDLNRILGDLQLGEFIYEQPATGDIEYIFKHALTQEVAYNSLLSDRRKSVHEQVGLSIELCFASSLADHYDELAHHFQQSGSVLKALEYLLHAGQQATHRLAYIESKELFGRALELVAGLKPTVDRDRTESLVRLNLAISTIFNEVGTFMDAGLLASLERAHTLCEELGRDTHHCDVLSALAFLYANRAETDKTREVCEELLAIAAELGDTDLVGRAHFWAAFSALWSGDFIVAMKSFDQAYELPRVPRSRQELSYGGWQPRTRVFGALALIVRGFPDRALARYEEAEALVREEMDPSLAFPMLAWSAYLNIEIGNPERALKASEEGSRLATQDNVSAVFALYKLWRARSLVQLGKIEQGIDEMVRLKGIIMAYAATAVGSTILPAYVEACLIARRRTEGLEAVSRGLEIVEIIKTRFAEAELYRLKGDLLLLGGRQWENEAEESFRKAITIARRQTAKWWELRSTVRLARVLRVTDRNSEARAMLADIYNWFTEGFDTADLKDAKALLEELNS